MIVRNEVLLCTLYKAFRDSAIDISQLRDHCRFCFPCPSACCLKRTRLAYLWPWWGAGGFIRQEWGVGCRWESSPDASGSDTKHVHVPGSPSVRWRGPYFYSAGELLPHGGTVREMEGDVWPLPRWQKHTEKSKPKGWLVAPPPMMWWKQRSVSPVARLMAALYLGSIMCVILPPKWAPR